jgi:type II secretory pathway pseudopilin PulG
MKQKIRQLNTCRGFTYIEVLLGLSILVVAILGASGYKYYSVKEARRAEGYVGASMVGNILLESWRGNGGAYDYDPINELPISILNAENFSIATSLKHPSIGESAYLINGTGYLVVLNGVYYYTALSVEWDSGVKFLNADIVWNYFRTDTVTREDNRSYSASLLMQ